MNSLSLLGIFLICLSDAFGQQCDLQGAMGCLQQIQSQMGAGTGSVDYSAACSFLDTTKSCLAPYTEACQSDQNYQQATSMLTMVEPFCAGGTECTTNIQKCYQAIGGDISGGGQETPPTCEQLTTFQTCMSPLSQSCGSNQAYQLAMSGMQQLGSACSGQPGTVTVGDSTCNTQDLEQCIKSETGLELNTLGSQLTCAIIPKVDKCMTPVQDVCSSNQMFAIMRNTTNTIKETCKLSCNPKDCNVQFTFPNGIPTKPEYDKGCSDIQMAIKCLEGKPKICALKEVLDSLSGGMKGFCMDSNLKNGLETYKVCLGNASINTNCNQHLTPSMSTAGGETEEQECSRIEKYSMCAKTAASKCSEAVQMFAADTARKVVTLKSQREGGIQCSTSAGVQAFPSFLLIIAATMMSFTKAF